MLGRLGVVVIPIHCVSSPPETADKNRGQHQHGRILQDDGQHGSGLEGIGLNRKVFQSGKHEVGCQGHNHRYRGPDEFGDGKPPQF